MAGKDIFRTQEGSFRILVTQIIDGTPVDWHLEVRSQIATPYRAVAHAEAVRRFVGADVEVIAENEVGGYNFVVKDRQVKEAA